MGMWLLWASLGTLLTLVCQWGGSWEGLEACLSLSWPLLGWSALCHNPVGAFAGQRVLSWKEQCSNLCLQCTCRGVRGQGAFPAFPAPCLAPHPPRSLQPRLPSHPRSSLPSAAAAVPGNLSLKSINFSHTPRERCKSPSLLPPWLLSATIWHRPPRPPTPALPLIPARQPELYDLSRESPRTKPWAALRPRWFF